MTSVLIRDLKGKELSKKDLAPEVFEMEPKMHLMHTALLRQLANARAGSANSKTRSEVRGGGRKPWRQKGTGRARAGSSRSPLWHGGGVIFGPKPRDYSLAMPRKARMMALKSALAARANELYVVQSFDGLFKTAPKAGEPTQEQPKTKAFNEVLKSLGIENKIVLLILDKMAAGSGQVALAARNLSSVKVIDQTNLNVRDLIYCQAVLTTEQVLAELENRFKNCGSKSACSSEEKTGGKSAAKKDEQTKEPKAKASKAEAAVVDAPVKKAASKKAAPEEKADDSKGAKKPSAKKKSE